MSSTVRPAQYCSRRCWQLYRACHMFSVQSMNVNARLYIYGFTQLRLARVITTELAPHVYLQVCSSRQEEHNDKSSACCGRLAS